MKYYGRSDPPYVPHQDTKNNHIVIYEEYEKWFDKQGDKGVSEALLVTISERHGEGDNAGNRQYFDYLVRNNCITKVRET